MIKKLAPKIEQIKPPFIPNGGCVPYVIAVITNQQSIVDKFPPKDEQGDPVSHDFAHANMMICDAWNDFMYFNVILAISRTYSKRGRLSCPKQTITFLEFSHSAIIYAISKKHNKDLNNAVLLLEVHTSKSVHCVGLILDLHTGKSIVIDRAKPTLFRMNIGDVFDHYRVLKVAILKLGDRFVGLCPDSKFPHLIKQEDGSRSDG